MQDALEERRKRFNEIKSAVAAGAAKGKMPRPEKLRRALKECSSKEWEIDWLETLITLNCVSRQRPARTHRALEKLRAAYQKANDTSGAFEAFFDHIKKILEPDFVTPHGYTRTFATRNQNDIWADARTVLKGLDVLDVPILLYAGTLLGLVRNGKLIGHDDDMDFAVYLGEQTLKSAPHSWLAFKKALKEKGLITKDNASANTIAFKIETDKVEIDLFPSWTTNGRYSVYPYALEDVDEKDIFPARPYKDTEFMMPANPEALLVQSYGENWRVPDPFFNFSWVRAKQRFSPLNEMDYTLTDG